MKLKLGNIELGRPFFQAPLSGYTDRAMRQIAREHGVPFAFSGLMLDKSTAHKKVLERMEFSIGPGDHPIGGQIVGTEPETMAKAAANLEKFGYDLIDLNFACPVPKVIRRGRGGALLQHPQQLRDIYKAVRDAVKCPVTMKLRCGFTLGDEDQASFWQICENAAKDQVDAVAIHGRSVGQRYRGRADWKVISDVKRRFPDMTIIGSGDLFAAEDVAKRISEENIDGVLIARGAIGNPWIFNESAALIEGNDKPEGPDLFEQKRVITQHLDLVIEHYNEKKAVAIFRKFSAQYVKRHPKRKKVLFDLITAKSVQEVKSGIDKWYGQAVWPLSD